MIVLEQVSVRLGQFSLNNINLRINRGEYLVIMGPSGAGKTVLLETIAGLRTTDHGRILINGNDAGPVPPEDRNIAIVYQDYSLFPHLTVAENIAYGLRIQKKSTPEIRNRVDALVSDFNISSLKDRYPGSLSGGEQQRVALARALAVKPDILLLDEPFAALDPQTREECMLMMLAVQKSRDLTILQVSHSREEAYVAGGRVSLLINGRIVQTGSAHEIFRTPQSSAAAKYAGFDNIFKGTVLNCEGASSAISIDGHQIKLNCKALPGRIVTVCIPGEHISLTEEPNVPVDAGLNAVSGVVTDILFLEQSVKIRIGGTLSVTAVIKRDHELHLPSPGDHIVALFRAENVRPLKEDGWM